MPRPSKLLAVVVVVAAVVWLDVPRLLLPALFLSIIALSASRWRREGREPMAVERTPGAIGRIVCRNRCHQYSSDSQDGPARWGLWLQNERNSVEHRDLVFSERIHGLGAASGSSCERRGLGLPYGHG